MVSFPSVNSNIIQPAVTFLLSEAGETKAMMQVMQQLDSRKIPYAVLANKQAGTLMKGHAHIVSTPDEFLEQLVTKKPAASTSLAKLFAALKAPCLVTGVQSSFQKYWADFFKQQGRTVVGFYQDFNYDRIANKAERASECLTHLITPNQATAAFFKTRYKNIPVIALGHPSLESFVQKVNKTDRPNLQRRLNLDTTKPTVLFVGGWGNGYAKTFEAFCKAVDSLDNINILFLPHPKSNGQVEQRILEMRDTHRRIKPIPSGIGIEAATAVSDILVFQDSTLSIQALFCGKQVLPIGAPNSHTEDSKFETAVVNNLAKRYKAVPDIRQGIMNAVEQHKKQSLSGHQNETSHLNKLLGIPTKGAERIVDYLLSLTNTP